MLFYPFWRFFPYLKILADLPARIQETLGIILEDKPNVANLCPLLIRTDLENIEDTASGEGNFLHTVSNLQIRSIFHYVCTTLYSYLE